MKKDKKYLCKNNEDIMTGKEYIMMSELLPNITTEDWMAINNYCKTEFDLVNAYAGASNMFFWWEDELYDDDVTQEEIKRCEEWQQLYERLTEKILEILKKENPAADFTGIPLIKLFTPFMSRNGFFDANGWWIRKK